MTKMILTVSKSKSLPRKEEEDTHELEVHFQQVSSIPSYPQPVHDDWLP